MSEPDRQERIERNKRWLAEHLAQGCERCGATEHLVFRRKDGGRPTVRRLAQSGANLGYLQRKVSECQVLCRRCLRPSLWRVVESMTVRERMEYYQPKSGYADTGDGLIHWLIPPSQRWIAERRSFYQSREWKAFRAAFLEANPTCSRCDETADQVHHSGRHHLSAVVIEHGFLEGLKHPDRFEAICQRCHYGGHVALIEEETGIAQETAETKRRSKRRTALQQAQEQGQAFLAAWRERNPRCQQCGKIADPLFFLHPDRESGRPAMGNLVRQGASPERLQEEIDECTVVCLDCYPDRQAGTGDG